jgi:hypothetical protein
MRVVELPKGGLLAILYGFRLRPDRTPLPKYSSWCVRSGDQGRTWAFQGVIGGTGDPPLAGYTEPDVTVLPDGTLLAALRTECARPGPLYVSRSQDEGKTWSVPEQAAPFGVLPRLLTLKNGVTVMAFGRPGTHLLFSRDGRKWEQFTPLVTESLKGAGIAGEGAGFQKGEDPAGRPKQTRTSGYTDLFATGPDSFLVAYDQFDHPDAEGKPRKTILVRSVTVTDRKP